MIGLFKIITTHVVPNLVKPENINTYKAVQKAYLWCLITHILAMGLFAYHGIKEMLLFNTVISIPCWILAIFFNRLGKHNLAFAIASFELITHQWASVYYVGWDIGSQYFFIFLAGLSFFNPGWKRYVNVLFLLFVVLCFIIAYLIIPNEGVYKFSREWEIFGHIYVVSFSILVLSLVVSYYARLSYKLEDSLRQSNKEITQSNIKLNELMATKNTIFRILAHDLRGMISNMVQFSDLLQDEFSSKTEAEKLKYISIIKHSSYNSFSLLNNLLQWASFQTDTISFNPEKICIYHLIDENINILRSNIESKNITIKNDISSNIYITGDRNMIDTIIRNILSNAIKFSFKEGCISLFCKENNGYFDISIMDTGIGMDEQTIMNLFKVNETKSRTGTTNEKGSGIGLIICKYFIDKHNGKIHVSSQENKGSKFTVSLPKDI